MGKKLSAKWQRDMLLEALEENIKTMRMYAEGARKTMKDRASAEIIATAQAHGMASGAEFCAEISERTLKAAQWAKKEAEKE